MDAISNFFFFFENFTLRYLTSYLGTIMSQSVFRLERISRHETEWEGNKVYLELETLLEEQASSRESGPQLIAI